MDKVLVTGATGHLGANLTRRLLVDGAAVRVLLRPGGDETGVAGLDVERCPGDLRDEQAVRRAVRGCGRVYHCAARISTVSGGEREIYETNVTGTRHVLDSARAAGVERVVVTGSLGAIGRVVGKPSNEDVPFNPFEVHTAYTKTKVLVEQEMLRAVCQGLDAVMAVSCAILGPHDYFPSRMGRTLLKFAKGGLRAYIDGGFEFVTTTDIVAGHLLAMDKGRTGHKYLFGSGFRSMDELMALFADVTGRDRVPVKLPAALVSGVGRIASPLLGKLLPGREQLLTPAAVRLLTSRRRADCSKSMAELGFVPTSIEGAVRDAHEHFVRRGLLPAVAS
ncbi:MULTISPECIES: NAD-dependent epimerase/dehydratase family protein [Amycolatopsis]|uniref:NAD-dependent epimerase/dehydratase family protein n=2 Tax=Amycolatopsis TaxID=1813 RepID=A0ABW5I9D0_9PSEU